MLNEKNERELAYFETVTDVTPIANADRLELVHINGWTCVCGKGEFHKGDAGVYFEIDSKLPAEKPFSDMEFLVSKDYKIKTQKIRGAISQGLFMPLSAFEGTKYAEVGELLTKGEKFLTKFFTVTYAVTEDNRRKAGSANKYKAMAQRKPNIFKKPFVRWLMKREWGRKLMFLLFGKKRDKKAEWPAWVVKTDEERVQNIPYIVADKTEWYATEKIDGTSTTFSLKKVGRKFKYYVCSRNVVMNVPGNEKTCYYAETDGNVYMEMSNKYNMEKVLKKIFNDLSECDDHEIEFVTIQAETYGSSIQKRNYGLDHHDMAVFNLIIGYKEMGPVRLNPAEMKEWLDEYNVPCVPIVDEHFVMPDTVEELLDIATGASALDGGMREGLVFRSNDGSRSFKAVSNPFLLKYHG